MPWCCRWMSEPVNAIRPRERANAQIQALDRTQPGPPLKKGRGPTSCWKHASSVMTHDYKRGRHDDALCRAGCAGRIGVLDGSVIGQTMQRHRHHEFIRFLDQIDRCGMLNGHGKNPLSIEAKSPRTTAHTRPRKPRNESCFSPTPATQSPYRGAIWCMRPRRTFGRPQNTHLGRGSCPADRQCRRGGESDHSLQPQRGGLRPMRSADLAPRSPGILHDRRRASGRVSRSEERPTSRNHRHLARLLATGRPRHRFLATGFQTANPSSPSTCGSLKALPHRSTTSGPGLRIWIANFTISHP